MIDSNKILKEEDPFLREIWAAGYDKCYEDHLIDKLILIRSEDSYSKEVPIIKLTHSYTIKQVRLMDDRFHRFLSDVDGSAEIFREVIKPELSTHEIISNLLYHK